MGPREKYHKGTREESKKDIKKVVVCPVKLPSSVC